MAVKKYSILSKKNKINFYSVVDKMGKFYRGIAKGKVTLYNINDTPVVLTHNLLLEPLILISGVKTNQTVISNIEKKLNIQLNEFSEI